MNVYLNNLIQAANRPRTATWEPELTRILTGHPDWS